MELRASEIVLSTAGRDRGKLFYVLEIQGDYLLLADGKSRTVEKPKRKKRIHTKPVARPDTETAKTIRAGGLVSNSELRTDLAIFRRAKVSQNQGGHITWQKTT